ncbi:MAG: toll/interleukin-1 receptor domain-containing protein [Pyrinomonadaceae bacterium]|jgi:hypothetical protein|nr:toll/interleukin-1 receptor domain-containing protein [Pyrinomonadaceae bacterium]
MNIFISSENIDSQLTQSLLSRLKEEKIEVFHSPKKPNGDWYNIGFNKKIEKVGLFIAVISKYWDSSTWMQHEIHYASLFLKSNKLYFWNPENNQVKALGMIGYLKNELPLNLDELVQVLKSEL